VLTYRAWFFDDHDHARHALDLTSENDVSAVAEVRALHHGYAAVELWLGDRRIYRLERALAA
jgi:hypothetical protein